MLRYLRRGSNPGLLLCLLSSLIDQRSSPCGGSNMMAWMVPMLFLDLAFSTAFSVMAPKYQAENSGGVCLRGLEPRPTLYLRAGSDRDQRSGPACTIFL